jgi:hypothetical protein
MLKKTLLAISLLSPLVAMSATANAGVQNRTGSSQSDLKSAFAYDRAASPLQPMTNTSDGSAWRYHGGPKYPW